MLKDFKEFAFRPGMIETGAGLVMALATVALIGALVEKVVMPIVGILFGEPSFDDALIVTANNSEILFGAFITALVTFIAVAFAVFFFIIKPYGAYQARNAEPEVEEDAAPAVDIALLTEIRDLLAKG